MSFSQALPYSIDFVIPGYERSYPRGMFKCLSFVDKNSEGWFYEFVETLEAAMGHYYLPLYRMGDGEYRFAVGYKYPLRNLGQSVTDYAARMTKLWLARTLHSLKYRGIKTGGAGYRSGTYSAAELEELKEAWVEQIKMIARHGILAPLFTYRETQFAQAYFVPIMEFFKHSGIELNTVNYYPFYFVYQVVVIFI